MNTKLHLEIINKVSFIFGRDQALDGHPVKTNIYDHHDDPLAYQAYLKGYEEGKRQRLENLLLK